MKIGEALSKLKKEKGKLSRFIQLRKQNVFAEEGKKPKFDPNELTKNINAKIEEIRKLKISIQEANMKTKVIGEDIILAEAIIKVNDLRSELAQLSTLFEKKKDIWYRNKDDKEMVAHVDEETVENLIEKLEVEKAQLDNKIQMTNWTAKITD